MIRTIQITFIGCLTLMLVGCTPSAESTTAASSTPTTTLPTSTTTTTLPVNHKKVAVGAAATFAINTSAVAKSWGSNIENSNSVLGQLGQGIATGTNVTSPQALNDPGTTYVSISAGEFTSCGLTSDFKVKCWGESVGDNGGTVRTSPSLINDGSTTYIDIASGSYHNCGITSAGVMKCWGDGWDGKLGNGDATGAIQNSPVEADAGTSYVRVAAGRNHTCGITTTGVLKCFGSNNNGQLGDTTTTTPRLAPVTVDPGVTYIEVAAGEDTTCGITLAGVLKCWGYNNVGQVGNNSTTVQPTPTVIDTGVSYSKIAVGASWNFHTCGITTAGVLKCWGDNSAGQLGIGTTAPSLVPVVVDGGTSYSQVAVGLATSCAITTTDHLKCWGANGNGQLGIGTTTNVVGNRSPVLVY